jgi:hypothetical protein
MVRPSRKSPITFLLKRALVRRVATVAARRGLRVPLQPQFQKSPQDL